MNAATTNLAPDSAAQQVVLHAGCGRRRKEHLPNGFQTVAWRELRYDIDPDVGPDIVGSIAAMDAVRSESIDALFSSHVIEHLYPHEVPTTFGEFHRVLRSDGFAVITCPDIQSVAELIAKDQFLEPAYVTNVGPIAPIDMVFGFREALRQGNLFMAHRTGFTARALSDQLQVAGFGRVLVGRTNTYALWALATKGVVDEEELQWLSQQFLPPWDSDSR